MTESALTFNGIVPLLPDILVDNFSLLHTKNTATPANTIKYCFVSHGHSDHYKGLDIQFTNLTNPVKILLTETTRDLILAHSSTSNSLRRNLANCTIVSMNKTIELEPNLKCTFIPNFHCLGSCMIFINDRRLKDGVTENDINVLYTGDVRFEDTVISSFKTSSVLSPFIFGPKKLNMLYLETTFAYRGVNIEIPENLNGIHQLIDLISSYPKGTHFRFPQLTYEFEEVWLKVGEYFGNRCNICIDDKLKKLFAAFNRTGDIYYELEKRVNVIDNIDKLNMMLDKQNDDAEYTFFIGYVKNNVVKHKKPMIKITPAIDLSKSEYKEVYLGKKEDEFHDIYLTSEGSDTWEGIFWSYENKRYLNMNYIKNHKDQIYLPMEIKFIYSRHSSFSETKSFLELFKHKPLDIYPLTESYDTWHSGFNMLHYYGIPNASYDKQATIKYGSCNKHVVNLPENLEIVDQWRSNDSEKENNKTTSFNSVSTDNDFDFDAIGQDLRRFGDHKSFDERKMMLTPFDGRRMMRQKEEKKRRYDRFLGNTNTAKIDEYMKSEFDSKSNKAVVQFIRMSEDNSSIVENEAKVPSKKRKVMPSDKVLDELVRQIKF